MRVMAGVGLMAFALGAQALGLGRLTVQSALGEPLRAEIDIVDISAEEAASLSVRVAAPDAFRAAGFDYNVVLSGLRINLQRRPDGRSFLSLTAPRSVQDPFIDLIIEVSWTSGRLVRDYTLLFDPPALRGPMPAPGAAASVLPPAASMPPAAAAPAAAPARTDRRAAREVASGQAVAPKPPAASRPAASPPGDGYLVKQGDTLARIAEQYRGDTASLDQMLVALLRANPEAFVEKNVNRLKAGVVLKVPSSQEAAAVPASEARQQVVLQSRDFNEYRRRLAGLAPAAAPEGGNVRAAAGKAETKSAQVPKSAAAADTLKLEKGTASGAKAADTVAADRAKAEANARVAELNRNMADLAKIAAGTAAPAAPATGKSGAGVPVGAATAPATSAPSAPASKATTPAVVASAAVTAPAKASAPAVVPAAPASKASAPAASPASGNTASATVTAAAAPASKASAPTATVAAPAATAVATPVATSPSAASASVAMPAASKASAPASSATAPVAQKAPPPPPPPPPPEPSFLDDLMENPFVPAAAGGIVALLAGFGVYRLRQRARGSKGAGVDSSFLESRLQPDSFFGASGGQRIDTKDGPLSGSSMVYSPSQLEAAGDVDPVAEADVYLAYGRDLQAEEILKEAIRTHPARVSVRIKLLEIFAKRRDARGFEALAAETHAMTGADSSDWDRIREMGMALEPSNPLYQAGGVPAAEPSAQPASRGVMDGIPSTLSPNTMPGALKQAAAPTPVPAAAAGTDVDLDLDFSLPADPVPASSLMATQAMQVDVAQPVQPPSLDISFDLDAPAPSPEPTVKIAPVPAPPPALDLDAGLSFDLNLSAPPAPSPSPALSDPGEALSFDLADISLDLPGAPAIDPGAAVLPGAEDAEADTKLALAEEFRQIGDVEAARQLINEVLISATGELRGRAQRLLGELS
jgi:pilus assembly protein FimV